MTKIIADELPPWGDNSDEEVFKMITANQRAELLNSISPIMHDVILKKTPVVYSPLLSTVSPISASVVYRPN